MGSRCSCRTAPLNAPHFVSVVLTYSSVHINMLSPLAWDCISTHPRISAAHLQLNSFLTPV